MGVDGGREVVVQRCFRFAPNVREHVEQVHLDVVQVVRVARELRIVPADVGLLAGDLARQQIGLVQEKYYRYAFEVDVVHDRIEDV